MTEQHKCTWANLIQRIATKTC